MSNKLDYNADRMCPIYNEIIGSGLCYDTIMAMTRAIKISSVSELAAVKDIEKARKDCANCPYSNLD